MDSEPRSLRTWPDDWEARLAGDGCPMCADGPVLPTLIAERVWFEEEGSGG